MSADSDEPEAPAVLAYERKAPFMVDGHWVCLEVCYGMPTVRFPAFCCQCLVPTYFQWKVPSLSTVHLNVFLCPDCRARFQRRYDAILRRSTVFMLTAGVLSAVFMPVKAFSEHLLWFTVPVLPSLVALAFYMHFFAFPFHVCMNARWVKTNYVWVRFPNPDYFKLFEHPKNTAPQDGQHPTLPPKSLLPDPHQHLRVKPKAHRTSSLTQDSGQETRDQPTSGEAP